MQIDDKHLLVFGGLNKRTRYNDIWVLNWDDKAWTKVGFARFIAACWPTFAMFSCVMGASLTCAPVGGGGGASTRRARTLHSYQV